MAEISFQLRLGWAIRGQVRRALKSWAFQNAYSLEIDEDKGFPSSLYTIKLTLPDKEYDYAYKTLEEWAERVGVGMGNE